MDKTQPRSLTPAQVARLFNVSVVTVGKWADAGLIPSFRTPGGQRRFWPDDINEALQNRPTGRAS